MSRAETLTRGAGRRANVEFVSAYPTRALRAEDGYAAVTGDVLSNLLAHFGWSVTREYFVNDTGPQLDALARGVYARCIAPGDFPDDAVLELAEKVGEKIDRSRLDTSEESWLPALRDAAIEVTLGTIRGELDALGVRFDLFNRESTLGLATVRDDMLSGFAERGLLRGADGAPLGVADLPPAGRALLATDSAGDSRMRPLTGGDGQPTYYANDLAYHAGKIARGYALLLDVFRRDHAAYAPGLAAGVALLGEGGTALSVCLIDPIKPAEEANSAVQAYGAGHTPSLSDLLAFYGASTLRHLYLAHSAGTPLEISLDARLRETLQEREARQVAAMSMPEDEDASACAPAPLGGVLAESLDNLDPGALMTHANAICRRLAPDVIHPADKSALTTCRALLGLTNFGNATP